ncbi:hypothetical protein BDP27DRAFT_1432642 [Rhodocollybia butyracea]|uniref:Uncharacterized protein n=1 Tax=Rhodocollybia butyracea TaxID=206335 RepID=A0A9P5TWK7_9AGAR|nr:hypothetical protein BDP27DRAFT_1432642 [Rhodocollybia butyracea]
MPPHSPPADIYNLNFKSSLGPWWLTANLSCPDTTPRQQWNIDAPEYSRTYPKIANQVTTPDAFDPAHPLTLGSSAIQIPEPTFQLECLLCARRDELSTGDENPDKKSLWVTIYSNGLSMCICVSLRLRKLNSLIFEMRFPPDYPLSPLFFRIITPRFSPFIHGGGVFMSFNVFGKHLLIIFSSLEVDRSAWTYSLPACRISICSLPSSIASVLLQIKLAISNLDPRPARLAANWNQPYGVLEALQGYKRAAATHDWTLPLGIDRLVR